MRRTADLAFGPEQSARPIRPQLLIRGSQPAEAVSAATIDDPNRCRHSARSSRGIFEDVGFEDVGFEDLGFEDLGPAKNGIDRSATHL